MYRSLGATVTALDPRTKAETLTFWHRPVTAQPLRGGLTNSNFVVRYGGSRYVVRIGDDIPAHQVMRFNEREASRAAHAAGLSPKVAHYEPGALVVEFVEGRTLTAEDVRAPAMLRRVAALIRTCHTRMIDHLRGPLLMFWPFHILRDYAATLREGQSRWTGRLPELLAIGAKLERLLGSVDVVFSHNDLLAANFIDDGVRLWLVDWDYAGFNSPLFDLANFASNNGLNVQQERELLRLYYGRTPAKRDWRGFLTMRAVSLLREAMWGMVSELHSTLDIDFVAYASKHLSKFEDAMARVETSP
jgi:thiamine kinase-like enzyme